MIELKNVTKKYGAFTAVENIDIQIKDGEIVGLLGPNGAGKTTIMNMITGFIEPTEGTIIVNDVDMNKRPVKAKRNIGYMPENVPLYMDLTVEEFITYMAELKRIPKKERKQKVKEIMEKTGLLDVSKKLTRNLSRGYKQRVSLAGAIIGEPNIVILDEPTVGLDPKQITEIRSLIKKLGEKRTVIISSHILSEISQLCEKVIIINKGKLVAIDTPKNLEEKTKTDNSLIVTVEDKENKISQVLSQNENIKEIKLIQENEDGTKEYIISSKTAEDMRKNMLETLLKNNITVFELKQTEATLEEAFIKIIEKKEEGKDDVGNN